MIAGDRNATTIVLHANHRDLVRFSDQREDNYRTVLHYLEDYIDSAPTEVAEKWVKEDNYRRS